MRYRTPLAGLLLLLAACAAPGEPVQREAAPPAAAAQEPAPTAATPGLYQGELLATSFAADSAARGQVRLWPGEDGSSLQYRLTVGGLGPATSAHMHLTAEAGARQRVPHYGQQPLPEDAHGPLVVTLMQFVRAGVPAEGVLVEGEITAVDLVGPLKGQPLDKLLEHLDRGETYVTVHIRQRLASGETFCCPDGLRGRVAGAGS